MHLPEPTLRDLLATVEDGREISPRLLWAVNRFWMETENIKTRRFGHRSHHHWWLLRGAVRAADAIMRLSGLHRRGVSNARDIRLTERTLVLPTLPEAFDGLTVLHLTDLHLDMMPGIEEQILSMLGNRSFDLVLLGGDYRGEVHGPTRPCLEAMERLVNGLRSRLGMYGVLGNHDDVHMAAPIEKMGVRLLINEHIVLHRDRQQITLVGTDDVHYYYTDQAVHALETAPDGFTLGLIHSPELAIEAERFGVNLYLCGHTHGGQVALPGGYPIITHLQRCRQYYRGLWYRGAMTGMTNLGAGCSGIPVRFNTRGEIVALTLTRGRQEAG
jgi:uncharacterized protein